MQVNAMVKAGVPVDVEKASLAVIAFLTNRGHFDLLDCFKAGATWSGKLLKDLNLVRRKCTTQAAKCPADIEVKKMILTLQVRLRA
jgi:hypothetical protein